MTRAWIAFALVLGMAGPAAAGVRQATTQTLPNGLSVVLEPDPAAASVHVSVCYGLAPVPPAARPPSTAPLLADLLAAEPAMDPAIARRLRGWGARFGSTVRPDAMCFETTAAPGALDAMLELEAARLRPIEIDQVRLDAARAARRAQWDAAAADPVTSGIVELNRAAFRDHRYARLVSGPDAEEAAITPAMIAEAQREHMRAGNAVLIVTGNFEPARALALIRQRFPGLDRGAAPPAAGAVPPQGSARRVVPFASEASIVFLGWRGGPASDPDGLALEVLALAIGAGGESILGREAGTETSTYAHVETHFNPSRDASLLSCMVVPPPTEDRDSIERLLIGKIEKLASEPLAGQDLERAKRLAEARRLFAMQTAANRARTLAQIWTTGARSDPDGELARLRRLTADDVRRAAAKVLVESRRTVVWIVPAGPSGAEGGR